MNWNFGNQISVYSNIYGILFFYLTNELLECFGDAGEACARKATTEYGHFRGRLLAKDHIKKGYEINLASFQSHYDLPCDERSKKTPKEHIGPGETRSKTFTCQFSDIWKYLAGQEMDACSLIGRIYCEQFHPAMWEGYDSRLIVDLETFLAKGDDVCRFHTVTAKDPRNISCYMPDSVDNYDWHFEDKMEVMANICAFEYFFLAKEAMECFGDAGEKAICSAIFKYGVCRGKLLAEAQASNGIEPSLNNLFKHYDVEREAKNFQVEGNTVCIHNGCRFCEICKILENNPGGEGSIIASMYCKNYYPGLLQGYMPDVGRVTYKTSCALGDASCKIEIE